ncbi:MAG: zinc-ribbon domain-containing protein [Acidobacteria bacterium]|nr:MAG: zinc-ribbon domain-containing protein [Acidobacteriota bacterium]REK02334.1 MAG: zinc-ribbon domain-containing protein [Acidobacteriota bacterium]REK13864.1 MAG: zinc-ribbon domain-containing protein [Acidobacteriota bacterium]REK41859.1 MAG: zinc-ribbon domain-containing protein [Acidobacteriota bacterium]
MICSNCNRENSADAAFCRYCASPLTGSQGSAQQAKPEPDPPQQGKQQNQQWNQPPPAGQQAQFAPKSGGGTNQKGILAIGLVVAGLFCCGPFTGVPAAILGWLEMNAIKEGRSPQDQMWMAQVGLWGGIVVSILGTIGWFFMLILSMASQPAYY